MVPWHGYLIWSSDTTHNFIQIIPQNYEFNSPYNATTTYTSYTTYACDWDPFIILPYQYYGHFDDLTSNDLDGQLWNNGNRSWNIPSLLFELEGFHPHFTKKVLEDYIFALLLNNHIQVKSWKISLSLFELEDFIIALSINVLEGFILVLLLKTIAKPSYKWCLATLKPASSGTVHIWKKFYCLAKPPYLGVSTQISKVKRCRCRW